MLPALLWCLLLFWVLRALNVVLFYRLVPDLPPAERRAAGGAFVSVVVPARNEERDVGPATESKLSLDDPDFEVVVVDDQSRDRTREILRGLERRFHDRLRIVDGVEPPAGWLGKPHALHEGVAAARAARPDDWLVFSDADVYYHPDLLSRALKHAESRGLDFLALFPTMEAKSPAEWLLAPAVANTGFVYGPGGLANVPAVRFIAPGGGVFSMVRRRVYEALGGHESQKDSVVDDLKLGYRAKGAGFRCGVALALDSVRVRMYHGLRDTVDGFTKNLWFGMGSSLAIALPAIVFTLLEGFLPTAILLAGLAGFGPPPGSTLFSLALAVALLTFAVRAAAHVRLRHSVASIVFHPVLILAIGLIAARSTWVNGVLGRHTWRGRERDARSLRF